MKNNLTILAMSLTLLALICVEVFVDITTGMENATTDYQKNIMSWIGGCLGVFSVLSWLGLGVLESLGKHRTSAYFHLRNIALLLMIYSCLVWISFFCTVYRDYSDSKIKNSVEYQAKTEIVKRLGNTVLIDENLKADKKAIELNKIAIAENLAVKNCNNLKADHGAKNRWKKITDCKNNHGAAYEVANNELAIINGTQNRIAADNESLNKVAGESIADLAMMPLAAIMTSDKDTGRIIMLSVAVFMTIILAYITNKLSYVIGEMTGDLTQSHNSPAQPIGFANTNGITAQQKPEYPPGTPIFERGKSESLIRKPFKLFDKFFDKQSKSIGFTTEGTDTVITVDLKKRTEEAPAVKEFNQFVSGLTSSVTDKKSERERLNTDDHAQISIVIDKKTMPGGNGRGFDDLEPTYRVLVDSIKDKSFFKSESTVGVNSIKRVCKLGTPKAQVLMTMLIERGVNLKNE